jgi:putative serine protease PepD
VRGVADDGPAAAAGITEGDLIVKVADREIAEVDDLHDALEAAPAGEPVAVTILRGTDEIEMTVTLPQA